MWCFFPSLFSASEFDLDCFTGVFLIGSSPPSHPPHQSPPPCHTLRGSCTSIPTFMLYVSFSLELGIVVPSMEYRTIRTLCNHIKPNQSVGQHDRKWWRWWLVLALARSLTVFPSLRDICVEDAVILPPAVPRSLPLLHSLVLSLPSFKSIIA